MRWLFCDEDDTAQDALWFSVAERFACRDSFGLQPKRRRNGSRIGFPGRGNRCRQPTNGGGSLHALSAGIQFAAGDEIRVLTESSALFA